MRKQNKRSLYESIMRDVAKVVKRRLNESDEEIDRSRSYKLSEIPFEWLLKPELNNDLNEINPEVYKLDRNGRIGVDVYIYKSLHDANLETIPSNQKPSFMIYANNVAYLFCKVFYLTMDVTRIFGKCNPFVYKMFKILNHSQPKFHRMIDNFVTLIDSLKKCDPWFTKHENVTERGDLKFFNDKEAEKISNEMFRHVEYVYPFEKMLNANSDDIMYDIYDRFGYVEPEDDEDDVLINKSDRHNPYNLYM